MSGEVWSSGGAGIVAGLGVAMPLGAIGAMLLREGLVNGFRVAAAAAAGVATVDASYCLVAALTGAAFAPVVDDHRGLFRIVSGVLVILIGLRQLVVVRRQAARALEVEPTSALAAYGRFVGLTAINPVTLLYFVALAGAVTSHSGSWVGPAVFVVAVGLSSLAWQLVLAFVGTFLGRSLSPSVTHAIGAVASLLIVGLGCVIVVSGLRS